MTDDQIIALYWEKNAAAIAESSQKYGGYCFSVAHNILHNHEDAEECVNDTWLHTWRAIPPQRPAHLRSFLAKVTRNLAINRFLAQTSVKRGGGQLPLILEELADCVAGGSDVENICTAKELSRSINDFVRALPKRDGNIFVRRYFFTESVTEIAKRYALTENHVAVILTRTRKKLKQHLIKEGYFHE